MPIASVFEWLINLTVMILPLYLSKIKHTMRITYEFMNVRIESAVSMLQL